MAVDASCHATAQTAQSACTQCGGPIGLHHEGCTSRQSSACAFNVPTFSSLLGCLQVPVHAMRAVDNLASTTSWDTALQGCK